MKILKLPIIIIMSAATFAVLLIGIWAIIFFIYYTALFSFILASILIPIRLKYKRIWLIRAIILLVLLPITVYFSIVEVNNRISQLASNPRTKNYLSSFSLRDKLGIYGLNLIMGISAYPIYPEISQQTLMMVLPRPKNGIRTFESDFAIDSEKVRD